MSLRTSIARPGALRGFSLIELMIAMIIGLVIGAALIQLFIASRVTYSVSDGLARAQESARFALEIVNRDIRMAGAQPLCGNREVDIRSHITTADLAAFFTTDPVVGWEYTETGLNDTLTLPPTGGTGPGNWSNGTTGLPGALTGANAIVQALPGSDVFAMFSIQPNLDGLTGCTSGKSGEVMPNIPTCDQNGKSTSSGVPQKTPFLSVNCAAGLGDICYNTAKSTANTLQCSPGGGNAIPPGHPGVWPPYQDQMELYMPQVVYYVVAESAGSTAARPRTALFRLVNCSTTGHANCVVEELAEGVESMQLFFRVRNNPGLFTAANIPGNEWQNVEAVHLSLIISSPEEVDSRVQVQNLVLEGGLTATANDRRVRQVYSNVVAVRNRIVIR